MEPSDLRIAMLRKSLEWTRLFADRCRYLLDGSRFLLGQIRSEELRRGGHSIVNLIRETLQCLRPDALDREIEFDFQNTLTREEKVTIDRLLIAMALFNIVDNAVKYSHRKQRIRLKLSMNSREWVLAVTDVGVYIRPEDRKSIFQTFVRRPTGQAQHSRPGTGLGLAVAKQVVEAHGGRVEVESDPLNPDRPDAGAVTTFVISIPR